MTCRILAEIARSRSRHSKFETKVFVMSRSSFSRSLSLCRSGLALGDSWGRIGSPISTKNSFFNLTKCQCRNYVPIALSARSGTSSCCFSTREIVADKVFIGLRYGGWPQTASTISAPEQRVPTSWIC